MILHPSLFLHLIINSSKVYFEDAALGKLTPVTPEANKLIAIDAIALQSNPTVMTSTSRELPFAALEDLIHRGQASTSITSSSKANTIKSKSQTVNVKVNNLATQVENTRVSTTVAPSLTSNRAAQSTQLHLEELD